MPQSQVPGYRVVDLVGRGGFAVVYRAVQVSVDREVAIKIDSRMVLDANDRRRFLREARAAGRLSGHPNVVDLYDAGVLTDGRPYLVMELCTGGSLLDRLRDGGALPVDEACGLTAKIADALAAAHAAGVLHRDIKPANILVNRYGVYGLADFGLAALTEPGRESSASLTALTPAYAAPEAFRQETPTEQADIYALGATLYALLSGRPPRFPRLGEPNLTEIIRMHDQPLPGIVGVPDDVMTVLAKALAADPARRHASATGRRRRSARCRRGGHRRRRHRRERHRRRRAGRKRAGRRHRDRRGRHGTALATRRRHRAATGDRDGGRVAGTPGRPDEVVRVRAQAR
jgi:serine/threonine protein kinase